MSRLLAGLRRWRPALRMAWRDLRSHRLRTLVVTLLVALPIAGAVVASTAVATQDYYSSNSLYSQYGAADARLSVTAWPQVRVRYAADGRYVDWRVPRGLDREDRRDPESVDIASLLPPGSSTTRVGHLRVPLASGGRIDGRVIDLDSPITEGLGDLASGRAPQAPDEVAVGPALADELGLLDESGLRPDAALPLRKGSLRVVGLLRGQRTFDVATVVLPPGTVLGDRPGRAGSTRSLDGDPSANLLVDLPGLPTAELRDLQQSLAAAGVSAWFRDAVEHPAAWGIPPASPLPVSPDAVIVGALVIGLGLVEVLVLVGAVFAVGARRQGRTLGLLMSSGGTPGDVRRTVLAQGVVIGVVAAVAGVVTGAVALVTGRDLLERVVEAPIYEYEISVGTIVAVALLGFVSAVAAAAIPAWGVGRMTASQALDGHVAAPTRRSPDRLRTPATWLVGAGLLGMALCGPWIARTYADANPFPSSVPVVVGAMFALVLLVGVVLLTPTLVETSGRLLSRGWLPWRLATRDATRNRGRTWAAVLAVGIVTTGAVFAGFGVSAANADADSAADSYLGLPPDVAEIYLDPAQVRDPERLAPVVATVERVLEADAVLTSAEVLSDGRTVTAPRHDQVLVVDDAWLRLAGVPAADRAAFAQGSALALRPRAVRGGTLALRTADRARDLVARVPAVEIDLPWRGYDVYLSADAAADAGLTTRANPEVWAYAPGISAEDERTQRLQLYGIFAQSDFSGPAASPAVVYAGAAGALLLTALVVGMVVALAAAEGRSDAATLASVGAPPWTRRAMGAGHALFVGALGAGVGLLLGSASGASLLQVVGTAGTPVPWGGLGVLLLGVPLLCALVGWLVTPTRLGLTRRAG